MAKILIIDDDETIHLVYRSYLAKAGHTVESAYDGDEGIEKVSQVRPDLILVDINMPHMSGFEVVRKIKEAPEARNTPVFVITSLKQEHHVQRATAMGVAGFITKPTRAPELAALIEKALKTPGTPPA